MTQDKNGCSYLKLSEAKQGLVELDDDFTCREAGLAMLFADENGLYFMCEKGKHHIKGQADDGEHCIGIYEVRA